MTNGVRSHPALPRSVAMNRSHLKKFEIRLGLIQTVALVAVVLGFLGGAFFLGFSSGKTTGHDLAYQSSIATSARIPLTTKTSQQPKVDVYAELQGGGAPKVKIEDEPKDKVAAVAASDGKPKEPEVSTIPEVKIPAEDPIENRIASNLKVSEAAPGSVEKKSEEKKGEILGTSLLEKSGGPGGENSVTLGDVAPKKVLEEAEPLHHDPKAMKGEVRVEASQQKIAPLAGGGGVSAPSNDKTTTDTTIGRVVFSDSKINGTGGSSAASQLQVVPKKEEPPPPQPVVVKKAEPPVQQQQLSSIPEKPREPSTSSTKGWFAQVAAPQKSGDAQQLSSQLRASGFKVTIENATVRGEQYYRVLVGPEGSIEQAQRLVEQLRRESYLQTQPFVRLVK